MNPIILEGPDGAGKSCLAESFFVQGASFRVLHNSAPKKGEDLYSTYIRNLVEADGIWQASHKKNSEICNYTTIFDRLHLGEVVYGQIVRGNAQFDMGVVDILERYLSAIDGQVVICLPPYEVCVKNWLARKGEEYVQDVKKFKRIYAAYQMLLYSGRPYIHYDYTRHYPATFARSVTELRGRRLPPGIVGSQWPRFLFVDDTDWLSNSPRQQFITRCIREAGFKERNIAFMSPAYKLLHDDFREKPIIVCLGEDERMLGDVRLHYPGSDRFSILNFKNKLATVRRRYQ